MHRTLSALGASNIEAYFLPKGDNIHSTDATNALSQYGAAALIVLDQGSRGGPPILPGVPTLILDHHQSTVFPEEAKVWHLQGNLACRHMSMSFSVHDRVLCTETACCGPLLDSTHSLNRKAQTLYTYHLDFACQQLESVRKMDLQAFLICLHTVQALSCLSTQHS